MKIGDWVLMETGRALHLVVTDTRPGFDDFVALGCRDSVKARYLRVVDPPVGRRCQKCLKFEVRKG